MKELHAAAATAAPAAMPPLRNEPMPRASRPTTAEEPAPQGGRPTPDEPMLYCPVCSLRLTARKCKLLCERCGYYMSCSDYY